MLRLPSVQQIFLALGALLVAALPDALAEEHAQMTGVDLRDVVAYAPYAIPGVRAVIAEMSLAPARFFSSSEKLKVFGIELAGESTPGMSNAPGMGGRPAVTLPLIALLRTRTQGYFFRRMEVEVTELPDQVSQVKVLEDLPLSEAHFTMRVSLTQRKAILEDAAHGIRKIYPLGVGGFDEGVSHQSHGKTRLMTPTYSNATLRRDSAIAKRTIPDYYQGLPFIPITRSDGEQSPIAFHILQEPESHNVALLRGFNSHGCMRLREKDLKEVFAIVMKGGNENVPLEVKLTLADADDHPFPLRNGAYETVVNCGTAKKPYACKDPKHPDLTWMRQVKRMPPLVNLASIDGDHTDVEQLTDLVIGGDDGDALDWPA